MYDPVPDSVREEIYDAVESCIRRGVQFSDFKKVVAIAWPEILHEQARYAEKECSEWMK